VRSLVALVLRVGLGLLFLMVGLAKFLGMRSGTYPASLLSQFADVPMPQALLKLFVAVLPYAEVGLGIALICGLLTILAATLSAALLLALMFGKLVLNDIPALPGMFTYLLVNAGVLWLSPVTSNYFSLDGLIFGWFWTPAEQGRYARQPSVPAPAPAPPPPPQARPAPRPPRMQKGGDQTGPFIS
jgi:uncharacterized membrane protein YphA (DoxX/SURF4 family)